jgi:hypothetical protein
VHQLVTGKLRATLSERSHGKNLRVFPRSLKNIFVATLPRTNKSVVAAVRIRVVLQRRYVRKRVPTQLE